MNLYAETSAVLAWLFDEAGSSAGMRSLADANLIVTSTLTLVESDRAILRSVALEQRSKDGAGRLQAILAEVAAGWSLQPVGPDIADRARASFPDDRIRSLDAIHLASALTARSMIADLEVLSLDDRFRRNAAALGFRVLPE